MSTTRTAVTLFSGFGLADVGLELAGFKVVGAVEKSPKIAEWHQINHPSCQTMIGSVEEFDYHQFSGVDLVHLSPPCQQHSIARSRNLARHQGADAALLAFKAIEQISPKFITLENVRGYLKADSYSRLKQFLWDKGYWLNEQIIDCADYGIPQSRIRFFLRGIRDDVLPDIPIYYQLKTLFGEKYWDGLWLQKQSTKQGWYSAIADLLPTLPETELANWQIQRLPPEIRSHLLIGDQDGMIRTDNDPAFTVCTKGPPRALLIRRDGQRQEGPLDIYPPEKPSPTIRALGRDGHSRQLDAWNGWRIVKITPEALGRFQTLPYSFKLPANAALACIGIGNGVPCEIMRQIATSFNYQKIHQSSKKMITLTDINSNNLLPSNDLIAVLDPGTSLLEAESQVDRQTITDPYHLDDDDEDLIGLKGAEIPAHPNEVLTSIGPENSLADIESRRDSFTAQAQKLEELIADYQKQVKSYRNLAQECEEKARAKVLEEFQWLAVQMQAMLQKADGYGVEEKAREILNSVLPRNNNSSSDSVRPKIFYNDELNSPAQQPPTSEEESSLSAQDSDSSDLDEHLTMQEFEELEELEELEENPEEQSASETKPKWTSDDWRTPNSETQPVVTLVERALGGAIGLDPTADAQRLIPAQQHFTKSDNCFEKDWTSEAGTVFMNCPFSNPLPFLEKLIEQIDKGHVREAIVLLPVRCLGNQGTGEIIRQRAEAHCIWKGRIAFIGEDGTPKDKANFTSCLIYFGSRLDLFIEVFQEYGNVSSSRNFVELESELDVNPELHPNDWRRTRDSAFISSAKEDQHLCNYKTFQVTYSVDLGDPPGIWQLSIIDSEKTLAWYAYTQEGKGPGLKWYVTQAKTHIDHLLEIRAEAESAERAREAEKQSREAEMLQQSLPLFQNHKQEKVDSVQLPTPERISESHPSSEPLLSQPSQPKDPQLTKEFKFANASQARSWEKWFSLTISSGKVLNREVKVLREPRSSWIHLENLTTQELVTLENLRLPKDPPNDRAEAQKMWAAAASKVRSYTDYSQMSDEELEQVASEARQDLFGEDDAPVEEVDF